jgi:hypothetical protein
MVAEADDADWDEALERRGWREKEGKDEKHDGREMGI